MTRRRAFDKNYLKQEFDKLNSKLKLPLTIFLIGGGAMAFYGLKEATKDIDIILENAGELRSLKTTLEDLGYKMPEPAIVTRAYANMQVGAILENSEGFRWDLFVEKVCNALTLSPEMKKRATTLYNNSCLTVLTASKEDVFLFKGITERDADVDDMRILAEGGLDWEVIDQECQSQSTSLGISWEGALYQNLVELREKYQIESPIERRLKTRDEKKLIEIILTNEINKGNNTIKTIAQEINQPQSYIRKELGRLIKEGKIGVDKSCRPHEFYLKTPKSKPKGNQRDS